MKRLRQHSWFGHRPSSANNNTPTALRARSSYGSPQIAAIRVSQVDHTVHFTACPIHATQTFVWPSARLVSKWNQMLTGNAGGSPTFNPIAERPGGCYTCRHFGHRVDLAVCARSRGVNTCDQKWSRNLGLVFK